MKKFRSLSKNDRRLICWLLQFLLCCVSVVFCVSVVRFVPELWEAVTTLKPGLESYVTVISLLNFISVCFGVYYFLRIVLLVLLCKKRRSDQQLSGKEVQQDG